MKKSHPRGWPEAHLKANASTGFVDLCGGEEPAVSHRDLRARGVSSVMSQHLSQLASEKVLKLPNLFFA